MNHPDEEAAMAEALSSMMAGAALQAFQRAYPSKRLSVGGAVWSMRDTDPDTGRLPVVMLPGAGGTGDVFYHAVEAVRTSRRVISITYPPLPEMDALVRGLGAALSEAGVSDVDVCGSSVGGYLAQSFALKWPERVRLCMLCNTFYDATWLKNKISRDKLLDTPADEHLANTIRQLQGLSENTSEKADFKRTMLSIVGQDQTAEMAKSTLLAVLGAPTLGRVLLAPEAIAVLDTDDDPVVDEPTRSSVRERYRDSARHPLPTGGHYPALLNPSAFIMAVRAHFKAESNL